jgi:antitoxin FitA
MFRTCDNVGNMPKMIQIRNVPDPLHRKLKARAAEQGLTLSDYLLRVAEREVEKPTIAELTERIRRRGSARKDISAAEIIRQMRDSDEW